MKIYVASSWRNTRQPSVVATLREAGHEVYDFRNPAPGDTGFGWQQIVIPSGGLFDSQPLSNPRLFRDEVLAHPVAQAAFEKDMCALRDADATVLVLPCGRSAHLELGWAAGAGQKTVVLLDDPLSEPELMYLMNTQICVSVEEVLEAVQTSVSYMSLFAPNMLTDEQLVDVTCEAWETFGHNECASEVGYGPYKDRDPEGWERSQWSEIEQTAYRTALRREMLRRLGHKEPSR